MTATYHAEADVDVAALVAQLYSACGRLQMEILIEASIDLLDQIDGDADDEPCGDELDTGWAEDEIRAA